MDDMPTPRLFLRILFAGSLLSAYTSGPRARPEAAQRVPDSAPEKIAAQRSAARLNLEEEDQRWGFEAAREVKQRQETRTTQQPAASPPPAANPGALQPPPDPSAR